ncbi:MAG: sigma 54-interacting transcriptional regulator [Desulfobacterales bacterium]
MGTSEDVSVDIRIVSATNKKLEEEVINGNFRKIFFIGLMWWRSKSRR